MESTKGVLSNLARIQHLLVQWAEGDEMLYICDQARGYTLARYDRYLGFHSSAITIHYQSSNLSAEFNSNIMTCVLFLISINSFLDTWCRQVSNTIYQTITKLPNTCTSAAAALRFLLDSNKRPSSASTPSNYSLNDRRIACIFVLAIEPCPNLWYDKLIISTIIPRAYCDQRL